MNVTWFIIVNPLSGGGKAKRDWQQIADLLEVEGVPYKQVFSEFSRHATLLATDAIALGYRKIVAVGGDGTISEVVNGIMRQEIVPSTEIEFAAIPIGTGNDWIKTHKIPKNYAQNVRILKEGKKVQQDIGKITFHNSTEDIRYFNNVVGLAYDAFVVDETLNVDKSGFLGQLIYLSWILKGLWKYPSTELKIESADFSYSGKVFCLNLGICRFSGGGMQTVPRALFDDGLMDITVIEHMPKLRVIWEIRRLYLGSIYSAKPVKFGRTNKVTISGINGFTSSIEADGEALGEVPVTVEIVEKALCVRC